MRRNVVMSKNAASLYVIRSQRVNKQNKTFIVEKLGTEAELREKLNGRGPYDVYHTAAASQPFHSGFPDGAVVCFYLFSVSMNRFSQTYV